MPGRVHGASRLGQVADHMAPPPREHVVDGRHAICGALDVRKHHRLHEARRSEQEGGIGHAACRGDNLASNHAS